MKATKQQNNFESPPVGTHTGICFKIIDFGTHESDYPGSTAKNREIKIWWELPDALMQDGRPFAVGKDYTVSLGDKANLAKDLKSWGVWDGQTDDFDISSLLGKACNLSIIGKTSAKGNDYVVVSAVMALKESETVPEQVNESFIFDLDSFDAEKFDGLSDYHKEKIVKSPEYAVATGQQEVADQAPVDSQAPPPASEGDYGAEQDPFG